MSAVPNRDQPLGSAAPEFELSGTDGRRHTLASVRGPNGVVVMFICNHCPYVQAVMHKLARDANDLAVEGIGTIAISSNDPTDYPEDSFENMKLVAAQNRFPFAYVFDETQDVAHAYGAVCTPEFFGYDRNLRLAYHGRLDDSGRFRKDGNRRELYEAMRWVVRHGTPPPDQAPPFGCSIKWRRE